MATGSTPTSTSVTWGSRWTFILAATGSAVGLGNIWKFPYITGEYGGGAFVLVYLACILAIGIPVMIAEDMKYDDGVVMEAVVEKFVKYFKSILHHNSWYFGYFILCKFKRL